MNGTQYSREATIENEDALSDEDQSISEYHSPPIYKAKEGSALSLAMVGGIMFVTFGPLGETISEILIPVFGLILALSCIYTLYTYILYKN